jgi:hypothetical protein
MTRLFRHNPELKAGRDNHLPQLTGLIPTTAEGEPLIRIGAMVYEPERAELESRAPKPSERAGQPTKEFLTWYSAWQDSLASATWVSLTIAPAEALQFAKELLRLVDESGSIKEPRSIGVLKSPEG